MKITYYFTLQQFFDHCKRYVKKVIMKKNHLKPYHTFISGPHMKKVISRVSRRIGMNVEICKYCVYFKGFFSESDNQRFNESNMVSNFIYGRCINLFIKDPPESYPCTHIYQMMIQKRQLGNKSQSTTFTYLVIT